MERPEPAVSVIFSGSEGSHACARSANEVTAPGSTYPRSRSIGLTPSSSPTDAAGIAPMVSRSTSTASPVAARASMIRCIVSSSAAWISVEPSSTMHWYEGAPQFVPVPEIV